MGHKVATHWMSTPLWVAVLEVAKDLIDYDNLLTEHDATDENNIEVEAWHEDAQYFSINGALENAGAQFGHTTHNKKLFENIIKSQYPDRLNYDVNLLSETINFHGDIIEQFQTHPKTKPEDIENIFNQAIIYAENFPW